MPQNKRSDARNTPFTCEQLMKLSQHQRKYLSMFAAIIEFNTGCTSPAEELIISLAMEELERGLTTEYLDRQFEEFRDNSELVKSKARDAGLTTREWKRKRRQEDTTITKDDDEEDEIPDWVSETPLQTEYMLVMVAENGDHMQQADLTREEFVTLKEHLAAMRGYTVGDVVEKFNEFAATGVEGYNHSADQVARHLETARDFYRACPELVVFESEDLDMLIAADGLNEEETQ